MTDSLDDTGRRLDIQGLRAIAVFLVVAYHCRVPGFSGGYVGVDVFFVISGFVIMRSLWRERERDGRISLVGFFARRIRRLMPAALLVLAVTVAGMRWTDWPLGDADALDATAVATYWSNLRFALTDIDYHAMDEVASPFRHYWSLAVEEQFYVLFPALLAVALRRSRQRRRTASLVALAVVSVTSVALSIGMTPTSPVLAFYSVHTRAWEFGAGALLYVATLERSEAGKTPVPAWTGWVGLAAIAVCSFRYDDTTPFPGVAALLPVLGTVLVIAAGTADGRSGSAQRWLSTAPMTSTGDLSYAWYLWHWPLLAIVPVVWVDELVLPWTTNLGLMAIALGLAWITRYAVEVPSQRIEFRSISWIAVGLLASAGAAAASYRLLSLDGFATAPTQAVATVELRPGDGAAYAELLQRSVDLSEVPANVEPPLPSAGNDVPLPGVGRRCHLRRREIDIYPCEFGDPEGTRTVVLTGDSHAFQWLPAIVEAARPRGWKVVSWTKTYCPLVDGPLHHPALRRRYDECERWQKRRAAAIAELEPDLVIASQADVYESEDPEAWAESTLTALRKLAGSTPVVYVLDTPRRRASMPNCLRRHPRDVQRCAIDRRKLPRQGRRVAVAQRLHSAGLETIDPLQVMCTDRVCPPIIGQFIVYRDDDHITATFARHLAGLFTPLLSP